MDIKNKFKLWWYQATDHRHKHTLLELMALPSAFALLFAAKEVLDGRPQLLVYVLAAVGIGLLAFSIYDFVGGFLFDLRVKREQGKTKIHDLR